MIENPFVTNGYAGGKFVHKYHLPSTSSVVSAVKGLLEKDFITQNDNVYCIYDRFFQLWLETGANGFTSYDG
jgi:hypothetical protein